MKSSIHSLIGMLKNTEGRVGPPMLLWFLGVPGSICVLLWFFIWRGN